jgi:hypothetical protein
MIKNIMSRKGIIHFAISKDNQIYYVCNGAVGPFPYYNLTDAKITCKNCKRYIK